MKTIFVGIILLFSIQSFGQLEKKVWLVGGSGSFSKYKEVTEFSPNDYGFTNRVTRATEADISAFVGYFTFSKFAAGVKLSGHIQKGVYGEGVGNTHILRAGPFARYYILNEDREFNLLVETSYQFGYLRHKGPTYKESGKNNSFQLMAGSEVFFNSSAGLEFLVG